MCTKTAAHTWHADAIWKLLLFWPTVARRRRMESDLDERSLCRTLGRSLGACPAGLRLNNFQSCSNDHPFGFVQFCTFFSLTSNWFLESAFPCQRNCNFQSFAIHSCTSFSKNTFVISNSSSFFLKSTFL